MKDVVYLFGAGASAGVMPVIKNLPLRMRHVANELLSDPNINALVNKTLPSIQIKQVSDELKELADEASEHASIDTVAKKYMIRGDMPRYRRVTELLTFYLAFEQLMIGSRVDKRYDSFFAAVLDIKGNMPKNLVLASWNYDVQLELAYAHYLSSFDPDYAREKLNYSAPFINLQGINSSADSTMFHKLNGTIGAKPMHGESFEIINYKNGLTKESVEGLVNSCFHPSMRLTLSYAWDMGIKTEKFTKLLERCKNSNTLVVIGYSFPYFNRSIDKELFVNGNFERIVIQDPNAETIKNTMESMFLGFGSYRQYTLITDKEVGFHIPNEMM